MVDAKEAHMICMQKYVEIHSLAHLWLQVDVAKSLTTTEWNRTTVLLEAEAKNSSSKLEGFAQLVSVYDKTFNNNVN
jgi:hypothetical protein